MARCSRSAGPPEGAHKQLALQPPSSSSPAMVARHTFVATADPQVLVYIRDVQLPARRLRRIYGHQAKQLKLPQSTGTSNLLSLHEHVSARMPVSRGGAPPEGSATLARNQVMPFALEIATTASAASLLLAKLLMYKVQVRAALQQIIRQPHLIQSTSAVTEPSMRQTCVCAHQPI